MLKQSTLSVSSKLYKKWILLKLMVFEIFFKIPTISIKTNIRYVCNLIIVVCMKYFIHWNFFCSCFIESKILLTRLSFACSNWRKHLLIILIFVLICLLTSQTTQPTRKWNLPLFITTVIFSYYMHFAINCAIHL